MRATIRGRDEPMSTALGTVAPEVWLSCAYSAFLLAVAHLLDLTARRVSQRSSSWRTGGFTYHPEHDAWRCPQDQLLWPHSFDPENRVVRYRGHPLVCNACPVKESCTSSSHGREIQRNIESWPASEAERFHRGIACAVVVLAMAWPVAELVTGPGWGASLMLVATLLLVAMASWPLWSHLRRTPAGFPEHLRSETPDEAVVSRSVLAAREHRRRAAYASDRRPHPDGRREPLPADAGWSRRRAR